VRYWVRWERSRWCPSYRVNGMKGGGQGGGSMQVVGDASNRLVTGGEE
jgi:hypothetical protein